MGFELVEILRNRKTGKYHCPKCLGRLKVIKETLCLKCSKCKRYYAHPDYPKLSHLHSPRKSSMYGTFWRFIRWI